GSASLLSVWEPRQGSCRRELGGNTIVTGAVQAKVDSHFTHRVSVVGPRRQRRNTRTGCAAHGPEEQPAPPERTFSWPTPDSTLGTESRPPTSVARASCAIFATSDSRR